jgi:hypothetical protein
LDEEYSEREAALAAIERAGQPMVRIVLTDRHHIAPKD